MKLSDVTAKLLANENLTVIRSNSTTAFFDTSTRVLSVPNWKDMTDDLETMFIAHEVGHALYTTHEKWTKFLNDVEAKKRGIVKGYFNVVEDARIERLVKNRYPGLRKTFFSGYKQLIDRDFFSLKKKDVNSLTFIDRVNLHFKVGYTIGIKFNEEEMQYIRRIETAETIDEAFALALECYEFAKKQKEESKAQLDMNDFGFDEDQDEDEDQDDYADEYDEYESDEDSEDDFDDSEDEEQPSRRPQTPGEGSSEDSDDDLESKTDKALDEKLKDLADTSIKYVYYDVEPNTFCDPIVGYKTVISDTKLNYEDADSAAFRSFKAFMKDSERVVNYLVKEFEMRKSATAYKRTKISKSGSLNLNKLHAYSLTDDIFKRIATTPSGKNHGMIFLLDWSG